jgi:dienelactone hydrolase
MSEAQEVEFDADGVTLRGLFFPAVDARGPAPCVVMAHGLAGEVAHFIADFAEVFADAGLAALVYDHRGWGRSDAAPGMPRNETDPWQQIRDYQRAITYVQNRSEVDPDRVGAWGTSLSAGHVMVLGAIDRRIKAVAGQAPFVSGLLLLQNRFRADLQPQMWEAFAADRRARASGEPAATIPVADENPTANVALPGADAYQYFYGSDGVSERDPTFPNQLTLRTIEYVFGYEPGWYVPNISPTPLLMVVASNDAVTPSAPALRVFETAAQPKTLVIIPGGHFDAYRGPSGELAKAAARDFFVEHLGVDRGIESLRPAVDHAEGATRPLRR